MKAGVVLVKKFVSLILTFISLVNVLVLNADAADIPVVSARSAIVMVAATGQVLYEKNAYEKRGIASTTKILTCIAALENASLQSTTIASKEAVAVEGTSIGLKAGDKVSLSVLVKGMLLESGNDAANVTAELVSGTISSFSILMNKTADKIGMNNSFFKNPSGLTEDGHYSCAYDMALLGSYAVKNSVFSDICSQKSLKVSFGTPEKTRVLYNHNKLLSKYNGTFGIKTGFTKASGRCLVSAVKRNGVTLVCVTLNAYDDWNDHEKLYNYSFKKISQFKAEVNLKNLQIPVVNSEKKAVSLKLSENIFIPFTDKKCDYTVTVCTPAFLYAGVKKGDYIGWVEVYTTGGILIDKKYLLSRDDAEAIEHNQNEKSKFELINKILNIVKDRR